MTPEPGGVWWPALARVVATVRAQHFRYGSGEHDYCGHCNGLTGTWIRYPCETILALDTALSPLPTAVQTRLGVGQ